MTDEQWRSRLTALLCIAVAVWLVEQLVPVLQSVGDILLLFFLAWMVAFILEPVVGLLERRGARRGGAVGLVYVAVLLGLVVAGLFLVPVAVDQLGQIRDLLQSVAPQMPTSEDIRQVLARLGVPESALAEFYRPELLTEQIRTALGSGVQGALSLATSAVTVVMQLLLVMVLSFYMLLDARHITRGVLRIVPDQHRDKALLFLSQWSASFGGFLRGQVIQATLFGAVVVVVMIIFRLDLVVVAALTSAVLMLLPVVGPVLSLIPPMAVALFNPPASVVAILLVLLVIQTILINVLTPRILSSQMGLNPLLVLFAILVGLRVGGLLGSFFAVPIMGVVYGMASALFNSWQSSEDAATSSRG